MSQKTTTSKNTRLVYIVVGVVALILFSAILIAYLCVRMRRKDRVIRKLNAIELKCFEQGNVESINSKLTLDEQADLLPYDRKYEFPREKLKLGKQLGGGAFGVVFEAVADGILPNEQKTKVAVKMVKRMSNDEVRSTLSSGKALKSHLFIYSTDNARSYSGAEDHGAFGPAFEFSQFTWSRHQQHCTM